MPCFGVQNTRGDAPRDGPCSVPAKLFPRANKASLWVRLTIASIDSLACSTSVGGRLGGFTPPSLCLLPSAHYSVGKSPSGGQSHGTRRLECCILQMIDLNEELFAPCPTRSPPSLGSAFSPQLMFSIDLPQGLDKWIIKRRGGGQTPRTLMVHLS